MPTLGPKRALAALSLTCLLFAASAAAQMSKGEATKAVRECKKQAEVLEKSARAGNAVADAGRYTGSLEALNRALAAGVGTEVETIDVAAELEQVMQKSLPGLQAASAAASGDSAAALKSAVEASQVTERNMHAVILSKGAVAQPDGEMTDKFARAAMDKTDALVEHAGRAQKRGDHEAVGRALQAYAVNVSVVGLAIQKGAVKKNEAAFVYERVMNKMQSHTRMLDEMLRAAPEANKPPVQQALEISKKGGQLATMAFRRETRAPGSVAGEAGAVGNRRQSGPATGNMPGQPGVPTTPP